MAQTLREHAEAERDRLTTRRTELADELAAIDSELEDVSRYLGAPKAPTIRRQPAGDRAARGSVQITVLETIQQNPSGLTAGQLKDKLPNIGQQSVSNALDALKKQGRISWEGRGQPYKPVPSAPE